MDECSHRIEVTQSKMKMASAQSTPAREPRDPRKNPILMRKLNKRRQTTTRHRWRDGKEVDSQQTWLNDSSWTEKEGASHKTPGIEKDVVAPACIPPPEAGEAIDWVVLDVPSEKDGPHMTRKTRSLLTWAHRRYVLATT